MSLDSPSLTHRCYFDETTAGEFRFSLFDPSLDESFHITVMSFCLERICICQSNSALSIGMNNQANHRVAIHSNY